MGELALYKVQENTNLFVKKLPPKLIEFMFEHKWLKLNDKIYAATDLGRNWVSEFIYFLDLKPENEVHSEVDKNRISGRQEVNNLAISMSHAVVQTFDQEYSPIIKLYNRQRNIAHKYLTDIHLQAGQKLFETFITANLQPNVTMNWENLQSVRQSHYTGGKQATYSETVYSARRQLYASLLHVGEEFAAILVEICLFGNGLEATEKAMNWPARSGKLLLTMALDRLAEHFQIIPSEPKIGRYLAWALPDKPLPEELGS